MRGVTADAVTEQAVQQARRYLAAQVPVGECLADQLLLPLAMAGGGSFVTHSPTRHTTTNIDVIMRFLPVRITLDEIGHGVWRVGIEA